MACGYLHSYYDRAPVPEGCEAVVMQEQTEQTDNGVRFTAEARSGQNIRRRGEDISAGAVVFPAGTRLTTAELPVIASLGIAEVPVIRKVRVALFSTVMNSSCPVSRWATAKSTIPTVSPYT